MNRALVAIFVLLCSSFVQAEYSDVFRFIIDEKYESLKEEVYSRLKTSSSVTESRELLKLLLSQEKNIYDVTGFESHIIPFYQGGCLAGTDSPRDCGSYRGYEFQLQDKEQAKMALSFKRKTIFEYSPPKRTALAHSSTQPGTAIHIISPIPFSGTFYFLLRDIEKSKEQVVSETIGIFKVAKNTPCKVAESNVQGRDDHYNLLIVFIKALGERTKCEEGILSI